MERRPAHIGHGRSSEGAAAGRCLLADGNRAYGFWIVASRDHEMARLLRDTGLEQVADDPQMVVPVEEVRRPIERSGHISVVTTEAERRSFVACVSRAFAGLGVDPATWASVYPSLASVRQDDIMAVVAADAGEPVAAAMGYLHDGVCEVIHVGTVPGAQRRGFGAAVTMAVVAEAAARGSTHAVLQATSMGAPVYQRLGFARSTAISCSSGLTTTARSRGPLPPRCSAAWISGQLRAEEARCRSAYIPTPEPQPNGALDVDQLGDLGGDVCQRLLCRAQSGSRGEQRADLLEGLVRRAVYDGDELFAPQEC